MSKTINEYHMTSTSNDFMEITTTENALQVSIQIGIAKVD